MQVLTTIYNKNENPNPMIDEEMVKWQTITKIVNKMYMFINRHTPTAGGERKYERSAMF